MNLKDFFFTEVMELYRHVTIPMEQRGIRVDISKLKTVEAELKTELTNLEKDIQSQISRHLGLFTTWFLNKDYPLQTATGKQPAWAKKGLTQLQAWQADYPGTYMFNLSSKHHLKKLFFDTLKLTPLNRTPTGLPQVDEDFLDSISSQFDWVRKLITYNKLSKILSTYVLRFLEEAEDGIYYANYMQHRTVSGRYSSDFQQLPRALESKDENDLVAKFTSVVRSFFISRDGFSFVDADYEQLEPTIFAHNSGDSNLISIFNSGVDFYSEIAIRTEGLEGVSSDKSAPNYLGKVDKATRQRAKAYALGIAYGMTGYKLKFEINCSEETANWLVQRYLNAFPKLKETMHELQHNARTQGFVVSKAGRVRRMPQAVHLFNTYGHELSNGLELWKKYHHMPNVYAKAKEASKTYKNLMNNALNFPIQSLASSVVNRACINLTKQFKQNNLEAIIVGQIHDEVLVECPDSEISKVKSLMKECLETVMKLDVPLRAEPVSGKNYSEVK
jgi:DNA polymerase-1